jgi:LysR family nod box-dependent transcriptional activator
VVLDALLTECGVSAAAIRLHRSQPAVSAALRRLRHFFNDDLLTAEGRGLRLTARGQELLGPVRAILVQIDATIVAEAVFTPAQSTRRFTIEASDYVCEVLLGKVISELAMIAPDLDLRIMARNEESLGDVSTADLIIAPEGFVFDGYVQAPLFDDDFVVVGWAMNPAMAVPMSSEVFLSLDHVAVSFSRGRVTSVADAALFFLGPARRIKLTVPRFSDAPRFLKGTQRIAVMHRLLAEHVVSNYELSIAELPFELSPFREVIHHRESRNNDAGLMWLRGMILDYACDSGYLRQVNLHATP